MAPVRLPVGLSLVIVSLLASSPAAQEAAQRQPTFRSRVTLVPLDVRVLDEHGRPVTDLRRGDFTVVEDGEPQAILHFSFTALTPSATASGPPELRRAFDEPLAPPTRRTFLILLGRGRQVGPGRNVPAAIDFLRERLLPQDQVAIHAWNRTTRFTTDHQAAARTLESQRLDFRLRPDERDRYLREGISFAVRIPVTAEPRRVKIVLYDVEMDRMGSAMADVPGR